MKSEVVAGLTSVFVANLMSLKHLPISFFRCLDTAQISLKERGTSSCLQAMNRQAAATASLARPRSCRSWYTCLNNVLHRSWGEGGGRCNGEYRAGGRGEVNIKGEKGVMCSGVERWVGTLG